MAHCTFKLLLATFSLVLFAVIVKGEFNCPPNSEIRPCRCSAYYDDNSFGTLGCSDLANQDQLSNFINRVKAVNPTMTKLQVETFHFDTLLGPTLTSLDLTPLTECSIRMLSFDANPNLTSIIPSSSSGKMNVEWIFVDGTPLSNAEVGNILTYVNSSTSPSAINIENSQSFRGNAQGSPIIPGLSSFPILDRITFKNTSIQEVLGSAFAGSKGLGIIILSNHNITKLAKDAFTIDSSVQSRALSINLDNNRLTSGSSSIEPGFIPQLTGANDLRYSVSMENNSLTTLPETTFKNLLFPIGRLFGLELKGNQFVCNDQMQWIKSGDHSDTWKRTVRDVDCINDPGQTIFTTDLVKPKSNSASSLFQFSWMTFVTVIFTSFRFVLFS